MNPLQKVHPTAWIAPSAVLSGAVAIGEGVSVWHNAVMRAECEEISIGRMTNIQDFVMIHVGSPRSARIAVLRSPTMGPCTAAIEDHCLLGSTRWDGLRGDRRGSIVAGGALVPEGRSYPPGSVLAGARKCDRATRRRAREPAQSLAVPPKRACTRRGDSARGREREYAAGSREAAEWKRR